MAVVELCACTDDDEKLAVYKRIRDDYDIFQFFLQMAREIELYKQNDFLRQLANYKP